MQTKDNKSLSNKKERRAWKIKKRKPVKKWNKNNLRVDISIVEKIYFFECTKIKTFLKYLVLSAYANSGIEDKRVEEDKPRHATQFGQNSDSVNRLIE